MGLWVLRFSQSKSPNRFSTSRSQEEEQFKNVLLKLVLHANQYPNMSKRVFQSTHNNKHEQLCVANEVTTGKNKNQKPTEFLRVAETPAPDLQKEDKREEETRDPDF